MFVLCLLMLVFVTFVLRSNFMHPCFNTSSLWFHCVYVDTRKIKQLNNQIITPDEMFDLEPERHTFTPSRVTVSAATMSCFCSVFVFFILFFPAGVASVAIFHFGNKLVKCSARIRGGVLVASQSDFGC